MWSWLEKNYCRYGVDILDVIFAYTNTSIWFSPFIWLWSRIPEPSKSNSILNLKYAETELSYDADFLHMGRIQQKQQIDTVGLSGLQ